MQYTPQNTDPNAPQALQGTPTSPTMVASRSIMDLSDKLGFWITFNIPGSAAATSTNYGYIFTANFPTYVISAIEKHAVAGASGSIQMYKIPNGSAPTTTTFPILAAPFDITAAANTMINKGGTALTQKNQLLNIGDSIALILTGGASLSGLQISVYCTIANVGRFRTQ